MWIPKTVEELVQAVTAAQVEESSTLDFKKLVSEKNAELAKDIAAMANEGGVLIYGVGEDDTAVRRPTELHPFGLKGVREKISNIANTGITPPLYFEVRSLSTDGESGYLIVIVPPSPLAPHKVTAQQDDRFYGRNAGGNRRLEESEIARFYEARKRWQVDREELLDRTIEADPPPRQGLAYIHLFAKPVTPHQELLRDLNLVACVARQIQDMPHFFRRHPPFSTDRYRRLPDGWRFVMGNDRERSEPDSILDLDIQHDGGSNLFFGHVGAVGNSRMVVFQEAARDVVLRFIFLMGQIYLHADFVGHVDLGVAVTGINGATLQNSYYGLGFAGDAARDTARVAVKEMTESFSETSQKLLRKFCHGMGLDPDQLFKS
jgi:hypothetical protein